MLPKIDNSSFHRVLLKMVFTRPICFGYFGPEWFTDFREKPCSSFNTKTWSVSLRKKPTNWRTWGLCFNNKCQSSDNLLSQLKYVLYGLYSLLKKRAIPDPSDPSDPSIEPFVHRTNETSPRNLSQPNVDVETQQGLTRSPVRACDASGRCSSCETCPMECVLRGFLASTGHDSS